MPSIQDIEQIKWCNSSGIKRDVKEIVYRGNVIWPTAYTYEIVNIYINYSAGSVIYARGSFLSGGNYAYLTGDIRRTRGGTSEILYNQPLTPVFDSQQSVFSIDAQGHITAQSRGTVEGSLLSTTLHGTYQDVSSSTSVTVRQEANAIVQTIVNSAEVHLGGYLPSGISCTDTSFSMTAYIERDITQVFTSTATKDTTDTEGTMQMEFGGTPYSVTNGQSKTFAVSHNKHSETPKSYTVSLSYDSYSTSATISQAADTYEESYNDTDYDCEIFKNSDHIDAAGGTCTLVWNAWHTKETIWTWGSDGQVDIKHRDEVDDTVTPVESLDTYNGFSRSGTTVTHLTMADNNRLGKRGQTATEKARYTVTNNGASDYVEFEVTNTAITTPESKTTTGFEISLSTTSPTARDGYTDVSGTRKYTLVTERVDYTSGTHTGGETYYNQTESANPTRITVTGPIGYSVSGNRVTFPENQTLSTRGFTITGIYDGYDDYAVARQQAGYITYATPSVVTSYDDIPAGGGTVYPDVSYSQTYGWNGRSSGAGEITSGGTVKHYVGGSLSTYGDVYAASLGTTTTTSRKSIKSSCYAKVTLNGKTGTSSSVTVYQQINKVESTGTSYDRTMIVPVSSYPASGGSYTITGRSFKITTSTWTSGDSSESESAVSSTITSTNSTRDKSSVSGDYSFTLTVLKNDTASTRNVSISMQGVVKSSLVQAAAEYTLTRVNPTTSVIPQVAASGTSFTVTVTALLGGDPVATTDITTEQSGMGISLASVQEVSGLFGGFNVRFNCTVNTGSSTRSGTVTIKCGDRELNYTVTQAAATEQVRIFARSVSTTLLNIFVMNLDTVSHNIYYKVTTTGGEVLLSGVASSVAAGAERQVGATNPQVKPPVSMVASLDPIS